MHLTVLFKTDKKINLIKEMRASFGWPLKEAKEASECGLTIPASAVGHLSAHVERWANVIADLEVVYTNHIGLTAIADTVGFHREGPPILWTSGPLPTEDVSSVVSAPAASPMHDKLEALDKLGVDVRGLEGRHIEDREMLKTEIAELWARVESLTTQMDTMMLLNHVTSEDVAAF